MTKTTKHELTPSGRLGSIRRVHDINSALETIRRVSVKVEAGSNVPQKDCEASFRATEKLRRMGVNVGGFLGWCEPNIGEA